MAAPTESPLFGHFAAALCRSESLVPDDVDVSSSEPVDELVLDSSIRNTGLSSDPGFFYQEYIMPIVAYILTGINQKDSFRTYCCMLSKLSLAALHKLPAEYRIPHSCGHD